jgi:hypothetical protein
VLGVVSLLPVATECSDPALGEERHRSRMQARLGLGRLPRSELGQAPDEAGADEEDVACADGDALLALGRLQVFAKDMLARLEPRQPAQAGDVEQDSATDEAVLEHLDRVGRRPASRHRVGRGAVVERPLVGEVAERVDVRRRSRPLRIWGSPWGSERAGKHWVLSRYSARTS